MVEIPKGGGGGGGGPTFGKNSQIIPYCFFEGVPKTVLKIPQKLETWFPERMREVKKLMQDMQVW